MTDNTADAPVVPIGISGGAGGHVALTEDLERAASALESAAQEVEQASGHLQNSRYHANLAIHGAIPPVYPYVVTARDAVDAAMTGHGGAKAMVRDMDDVGQRLKAVARAYEEAEDSAYRQASKLGRYTRGITDALGALAFPARVQWAVIWKLAGPGGAAGEWVGDALMPDRLPRITDLVNGRTVEAALGSFAASGGLATNPYLASLTLLSGALTGLERLAGEPRYIGANAVLGTETPPGPTGVEDLINGIIDVPYGEAGAIAVETTVHPDGTRTHVGYIPGTADISLSDPSPFDWNSNLQSVSGGTSDTTRFVIDALEAAGVQPGDSLMLVGHSQGGIVATQLAASEIADKYDLSHVVSVGSPTGLVPINSDVQYLHIMNSDDLVPGLDGVPTPDRPNVISVIADLQAATTPELRAAAGSVTSAHALETYRAAGQATDVATHSSIEAWRNSASDFLGKEEVTRRVVEPAFEMPPVEVKPRPAPTPQPDPKRPPESLLKSSYPEPQSPFPGARMMPSELVDTMFNPTLGTVLPLGN